MKTVYSFHKSSKKKNVSTFLNLAATVRSQVFDNNCDTTRVWNSSANYKQAGAGHSIRKLRPVFFLKDTGM